MVYDQHYINLPANFIKKETIIVFDRDFPISLCSTALLGL